MAPLTLRFDGDERFELQLLEAVAPRHIAGISAFLSEPRTTTAMHVMYDGPAMMLPFGSDDSLREMIASMPLENATCYPQPGDAFWFRFPPYMFGQEHEIWEIAVAYAPGVRLFNQLGWTPASVFARVGDAHLERLDALGRSLRMTGARSVTAAIDAA